MAVASFLFQPLGAYARPSLVAQATSATTGGVSGTVRDETGAPVAGASITVRGAGTYHTVSDSHGAFAIDNIAPGLYVFTVQKPGYDTATESDFAVFSGEVEKLNVAIHAQTFTSLRTIATVRSRAAGTFNTSTASVDVVTAQTFQDQADPQVDRVLNQIPGVQISLPSDDANGASLGAVTFPNVRGALSFETATLIDGHPLATASFGDYVSTYLNSYMLGSIEVIKGPGAMAPEVNGAIGGTVNFRTKDPTLDFTPDYTFGYTSTGGTFFNFGFTGTSGRLGYVAEVAGYDDPSALNGKQVWFDPTSGDSDGIVGSPGNGQGYQLGTVSQGKSVIPGTASYVYNQYPLVACCYSILGDYDNTSELLKLRYKFSGATTATLTYLGGQTTADENGDNSALTPSVFTPGASYTGSALAVNSPLLVSNVYASGQPVLTHNNEPIFEGEVRTLLGNDTLLGRFYHAGIVRVAQQGLGLDVPTVLDEKLYGVGSNAQGQNVTYNGTLTPVYYYDYFLENETDKLTGYSFEYDHPFSSTNDLTASFDTSTTNSTDYEIESNAWYDTTGGKIGTTAAPYYASTDLPNGSTQTNGTFLLRDTDNITDRLSGILSLYENTYQSTYAYANSACSEGNAACAYNSPDYQFRTSNSDHFDQRLGLTYRLNQNAILRLAAGSAIAPPYLYILSQRNGTVSVASGGSYASVTLNAGTLKPETASEIDLGADVRIPKPSLYLSGDVYQSNLFNHFVDQTESIGTCDNNLYNVNCGTGNGTATLFASRYINVSNSRYQGAELSIKRVVDNGLNFSLSGAVQHAYAYNLPKCFYGSAGNCGYYSNLGIIPGENFTGPYTSGEVSGYGYGGFANQNIPYFQGNAEISYHWASGIYASFGSTFYGKNNSFNEPPFTISYATVRVPLSDTLSLQVSGSNIFNTLDAYFPIIGGGVDIPLAGSPVLNGVHLPAQTASTANVLGPATYRFVLTKTFGRINSGNGSHPNSSQSSY